MTARVTSTTTRKPLPVLRSVLVLVLGLAAVWAILTRSLVATLATRAPELALRLRSDDPGALIALAERTLSDELARLYPTAAATSVSDAGFDLLRRDRWALPAQQEAVRPVRRAGAQGEGDDQARPTERSDAEEIREAERTRAKIRAWAREVLAQEPGNDRVLGILGILAYEDKDEELTAKLMKAAAQRSLREAAAQFWLVEEATKQQQWAAAVEGADRLLLVHRGLVSGLAPLLARIADDPDGLPHLVQALGRDPTWRPAFFREVLRVITDARTPLNILLALKKTENPPTQTELKGYTTFLVDRRFYELAHYTWLQFLPPEQLGTLTLLYNGSFEQRPSGMPFDWILQERRSAVIEIARRPDRAGSRALVVEFGQGRVDIGTVSQLVRLGPGRYRFDGQTMGEVVARRGLRWRVLCGGASPTRIGESEMLLGQMVEWRSFTFTFTVPETDCSAQFVRLELDARMESERLISGVIWFDELSIVREAQDERPR